MFVSLNYVENFVLGAIIEFKGKSYLLDVIV